MGGETVKFEVGGEPGDPVHRQKYVTLDTSWTQYFIDLTGANLNGLKGGFCWVAARVQNPDGCTFYLDDIKYNLARLDSPRFIQSWIPSSYSHEQRWALNQAYTYDNALAMLAFLARGTEEDMRRARLIGDAFKFAQENDRLFDPPGRLRNAYSTGDIADHETGKVRLPGWWDEDNPKWFEDDYQVGTYAGEMAWTVIAWLTYDSVTAESRYLNYALALASWIADSCYDSTGIPGYIGGFSGPDTAQERQGWKSTEHNIDVYVAFDWLYRATAEVEWLERANRAWSFVEAMWDASTGHFWAGTDEHGNVNYFSPLDAQTWALLASLDAGAYGRAISWAEDSCRVDTLGYQGFHFSTVRDGIWWEGTAQMCCAFQVKCEQAKSETFLDELRRWQTLAPNGNSKGIVATCPDSIWTGLYREGRKWFYYARLHVGATGWYIFAERNHNPYWHKPTEQVEMSCEPLTPVSCRGKNFYFKLTVYNHTEGDVSGTLTFSGYSGYDCDPDSVLIDIPRSKTYPPGVTETHYFLKVPNAVRAGQYSTSVGGTLSDYEVFCCMNTDIVQCSPWRTGDNTEWELLEVDRSEVEKSLPTLASLSQNHPNPFNASTTIHYQLPVDAHIKLEVYNTLGERVATLVDESQQAGYKSVIWDASAVSSGLYFYKLTAGDFTETRRMMLVK